MSAQPDHERPTGTRPESPQPSADACRAEQRRQEGRLFARYRRFGDRTARNRLIDRFLPLADRLARRYHRGGEPLEDLTQVARVGLVKAVDRFDPDRGVAFTTYAIPTIVGELRRHFRDFGWSVHVPRGMKNRILEVETVASDLAGRLGRSPSPAEVATAAGISTEEVLEAREAAVTADPVSLDAPLAAQEEEGHCYGDTLGQEDDRLELVELAATVGPELRALPGRDRLLLHLRFVDSLTQSEIAEQVGISQMQVSRRLRWALDRVGSVANPDPESATPRAGCA